MQKKEKSSLMYIEEVPDLMNVCCTLQKLNQVPLYEGSFAAIFLWDPNLLASQEKHLRDSMSEVCHVYLFLRPCFWQFRTQR